MSGAVAALFGMVITIVLSALIMIHGWGLEPQSWGWIIGGTIVNGVVLALVQAATGSMSR